MDNWTVPRLPESIAQRTFQSSRRGLALPRQRLKGRRGRRDFGTASTRRRDAAWWRDEKRKAFGWTEFQTVEAARAQSRKGRICRSGAEDFAEPSGKVKAVRGPGRRDTVSELPGGRRLVLAIDFGLRQNRRRRERRAITKPTFSCSQEPVGHRHRDAGCQVPLGAHEPARVGSTARSAPFLVWALRFSGSVNLLRRIANPPASQASRH